MITLEQLKTILLILTSVGSVLVATWKVGDYTGYRFVWKYELDRQGWYISRTRLIDKKKAGTITPFESGVLCGLDKALQIPEEEGCPQE